MTKKRDRQRQDHVDAAPASATAGPEVAVGSPAKMKRKAHEREMKARGGD